MVTAGLIAVNVAMFLLVVAGGEAFVHRFAVVAVDAAGEGGVARGDLYRLVSAAFLHQQALHIGLNMLALWIFGSRLEASLGGARFLGVYLLSGLAGGAASYAFNPPFQSSLGASGAIFGVVGAVLVTSRRTGATTSGLLISLAVLLLPGFLVPNIDWRAPLGGLAAGVVLGIAYAYAPRAGRALYQLAAAGAVVEAVLALVFVRTAQITS